jgi:hypothetical protein
VLRWQSLNVHLGDGSVVGLRRVELEKTMRGGAAEQHNDARVIKHQRYRRFFMTRITRADSNSRPSTWGPRRLLGTLYRFHMEQYLLVAAFGVYQISIFP